MEKDAGSSKTVKPGRRPIPSIAPARLRFAPCKVAPGFNFFGETTQVTLEKCWMLARPILTLPCISLEDYWFSAKWPAQTGRLRLTVGAFLFAVLS